MLIQGILIVCAVLGLFGTLWRLHKHDYTVKYALPWLLVWVALAYIAWNPDSTARFARILGVGRGADAVVYLSIVVLFFLVFRCLVALEKMKRDITLVVRHEALRRADQVEKKV